MIDQMTPINSLYLLTKKMINKDYLYTDVYDSIDQIILKENSTYIYTHDAEDRSHLADKIEECGKFDVNYVGINYSKEDDVFVIVGQEPSPYSLWEEPDIQSFFQKNTNTTVYLDVSGMNNRVSSAFINYFMTHKDKELYVIYVEPERYTLDAFKKYGPHHDLSESIDGIDALPGLATIIPDDADEDIRFIPILGFEGGRFTYLLDQLATVNMEITPIVGVPGYRIEYPFEALWGNRRALKDTGAWMNIKYAAANSIVDIFLQLDNIVKHSEGYKFRIAPIGTKPHAIGAIIFAFLHTDNVDLIYDNPKREVDRTRGIGKILICNVTKLISDNQG